MIEKLNIIFHKLLSRKFFAFLIACVFLWKNKISQTIWMWIAIAYMFGEASIDVFKMFKSPLNKGGN